MADTEKSIEAGRVADPMPIGGAQPPAPSQIQDNISSSSSEKVADGRDGLALGTSLSQTPSQAEKLGKGRIAVIMLSLCIALFLAALDMTIITTALPAIAGSFQASTSEYTWVGSAYLLANAASVPLWGKLSDIWGRKPVILLANVVFLVGSLLCAVSVSIGMLIGSRVLQGVGGGGLVILVNIVISDLFSMRERAKYFGLVGMTWALASAVGPVLGGVFTEKVSWRWCFYINLPLDGFAFIMLFFFLDLHTPRTPFLAGIRSIDWIGVVTIVSGVVMFLLGLESGGVTHPWSSAYTLCLLLFGILTLALFFLNEWKFAKYPIMPLHLFNNVTSCASYASVFLHGFVFISGSYYLPLYFQTVLSATPLLSGIYLFPFALSLSFQSALVGLFIKRTGRYREPIWFGFALMTLGFGLFIDLDPTANWPKIILYQIIAGIGVGPNFQSPLIALQSTVKPQDIATATSTFGFLRQLSTSISVVLGGVVFTNVLATYDPYLASVLPADTVARLTASSSGSNTEFLNSLPPDQKAIVNVVYTDSLQKMWIFYTAVSALAIVVSAFIGRKVLSERHEVTRTGLVEQERARVERVEERRVRREGAPMPVPAGEGEWDGTGQEKDLESGKGRRSGGGGGGGGGDGDRLGDEIKVQ